VRLRLTCHANGTFFRFARSAIAAMIRDILPGPVKVLMNRFWRFVRTARAPTAATVPKAMVLMGRLVADAILKEGRNGSYERRHEVLRLPIYNHNGSGG